MVYFWHAGQVEKVNTWYIFVKCLLLALMIFSKMVIILNLLLLPSVGVALKSIYKWVNHNYKWITMGH